MRKSNYLIDEIKVMHGSVVAIDPSDYLLTAIDKNKDITSCSVLESLSAYDLRHSSIFQKKLSSKKMKKKFKKKRIDVFIVNNTSLNCMLNTFVRDSIYMAKKNIYIYGSEEVVESSLLIKRYQRYDTKIIKTDEENIYILKIDTSKAKNNWFKDLGYYIADSTSNFIDMFASFLAN